MDDIGERFERICAHKLAFWVFTVAFIGGITINVDVTNIFISYFTAAILLLTLSSARRSNRALHAKLDGLVHAADDVDDSLERLEERDEREIEKARPS